LVLLAHLAKTVQVVVVLLSLLVLVLYYHQSLLV
tara:strand:+ start:396 stop:497 length:102 start_codon:yes stop_codon:yes gene_type:complete